MKTNYPYQNAALSVEERLEDLLSRMTLEEKVRQTDQYSSSEFLVHDEAHHPVDVDEEALHCFTDPKAACLCLWIPLGSDRDGELRRRWRLSAEIRN